MEPLRAGQLKHVLTLQTPFEDGPGDQNEYGEIEPQWEPVCDLRAEVRPITGLEVVDGGQTTAQVTHRVRMRYTDEVTPKRRFKFGDRVLNITSVLDPFETRRELLILCKEAA